MEDLKKIKIPTKDNTYEIGDLVEVYEDYHNNIGYYGEGLLLEKIEEMSPLTFILEDNYGSPRLQEVWSFEKWKIEMTNPLGLSESRNIKVGDIVNKNLRCFARIGVSANSVDPIEKPKQYSEIIDNFEIVPGWGQCF